MAYIKPIKMSGKVTQGQLIGKALNVRECNDKLAAEASSNHFLFQMYKFGHLVDPTTNLQRCMCTGQICQSNAKNTLIGAYKAHETFGMGLELACTDLAVSSVDGESDQDDAHVPLVYSPIEGSRLGRMRLRDPSDKLWQNDCKNDAIFITGDGAWKDFTVRIYNVKFTKDREPGIYPIKQGDPIAQRLDCDDSTQSVFMEVRHRGQLVNITNQIQGNTCKMPEF